MELVMSGLLIGMSGMLLLLIASACKDSTPRRNGIRPSKRGTTVAGP